jgi:hypothetical protein
MNGNMRVAFGVAIPLSFQGAWRYSSTRGLLSVLSGYLCLLFFSNTTIPEKHAFVLGGVFLASIDRNNRICADQGQWAYLGEDTVLTLANW